MRVGANVRSVPDAYSGAQREARESANAIEDSMEPSPPTEKDCGNRVGDLEIDLSASQEFDDVILGEQEIREREDVAKATSPADARSDQPASILNTKNEGTRPTKSRLQEVLVDTAGLEQQRHAVDSGTSTSAIVEEDAQHSDIDTSMLGIGDTSLDESVLTVPIATIDCTSIDHTTFQSPTNERQRPSRVTDRPSRYRDSAFETQFQPTLRRRNCRKIKKRNPAEHDIINDRECQDLGRGERKQVPSISKHTTQEPTPTDRAKLQGIVSQKRQPKIGRHSRFITNLHPYPSGKLPADVQSSRNDRYDYTPSGNKNKKKTGNSRNSPETPHLKKKSYTRHQAMDRREPAVADSDDHNEFLIAPTITTHNRDSAYDQPDARHLKFRSIRQMAPPAALRKLNRVVSATHREANVDARATTTTKTLQKGNCCSLQKDPDNLYRADDRWDIVRPWKRKKSKQLDPHFFNANSATIHLSSLPEKF